MEGEEPEAGPLAGTKLACQACRASKVKCDVERQPSGVCGRCCRLGLQCLQPPPAKRGRPVKLAAARVEPNALGPEPHPLPLPHDPPAPDLDALASHKHLHTEPAAALASTLDKISISPYARPPQSFEVENGTQQMLRTVLSHLNGNRQAQAMLIAEYLSVARRTNSAERMGRGLLLAGELQLSVDDVLPAGQLPTHSPFERERMPDFIAEWFTSSELCVTRLVSDGYIHFEPNEPMARHFYGAPGTKGANASTPLNCAGALTEGAELGRALMWRSMTGEPQNGTVLAKLIGDLIKQVGAAAASGGHAEMLTHVSAEGATPIRLRTSGGVDGRYSLRARMVARDGLRFVWTAIIFSPMASDDGVRQTSGWRDGAGAGVSASAGAGAGAGMSVGLRASLFTDVSGSSSQPSDSDSRLHSASAAHTLFEAGAHDALAGFAQPPQPSEPPPAGPLAWQREPATRQPSMPAATPAAHAQSQGVAPAAFPPPSQPEGARAGRGLTQEQLAHLIAQIQHGPSDDAHALLSGALLDEATVDSILDFALDHLLADEVSGDGGVGDALDGRTLDRLGLERADSASGSAMHSPTDVVDGDVASRIRE